MIWLKHGALAFLVSAALSAGLAWLTGEVSLVGLSLVTLVCASMGMLAGIFLGGRLFITAVSTGVIRCGVFILIASGGPNHLSDLPIA